MADITLKDFGKQAGCALLAGMFISLGALLSTITLVGGNGSGIYKVISGMAFSVGLIMTILSSGALYTGMLSYIIHYTKLGKSRVIYFLLDLFMVWGWNFIGALLMVVMLHGTFSTELSQMFVDIGNYKVSLLHDGNILIFKAIMCNILVSLAVLLARKAHCIIDLIVLVGIPVTVFVACGFEHSVANMFYLFMAKSCGANISLTTMLLQIFIVSFGNFIGGIYMSAYNETTNNMS